MSSELWSSLHGATTHFPIALVFLAAGCDAVALGAWQHPIAPRLRFAGGIALGGAALGSMPVVFSGLIMTHGRMGGAGAMRWHHAFVWPAFGLTIAAAAWRLLVRDTVSRRAFGLYVAVLGGLVALLAGAGYWGGELLHAFP